MNLLKEIFHSSDLNVNGKTITREAVRGIIYDEQAKKILMIYSAEEGDYKFPGGGVEQGETHEETLIREILEECGAHVSEIEGEFGKIIEYNKPKEEDFDAFIMTSNYYMCKVDKTFGNQKLDDYEKDLGFEPAWVDIDTAIAVNNEMCSSKGKGQPWTERDTYVLEQVKQKLMSKGI